MSENPAGTTLPGPRDPATVIREALMYGTSGQDRQEGVAALDSLLAALARVEQERDELRAERNYYLAAFDAAAETMQKAAGDA